jgi:tryptophan 2,3-dioxygenase
LVDTTIHDGSRATVTWPEHVGAEGLSARASRALDGRATAARALAALRAWLPGLEAGASAADLVDAVRPDRFPYADVLAHYHAVGRTHAATELTERLRFLNDLLQQPALAGGRRMWPLPEWLPSTVDQDTGNYDSYLIARLLDSLPDVSGSRPDGPDAEGQAATDRTLDALLGTLAADLALVEADALRLGRPSRLQVQRTRGCLIMLSRLDELAPKYAQRPALPADLAVSRSEDPSDSARLAETTARLATEVRENSPGPCRLAVELSMLPATPLHDELMFIRSIQIFETLYHQIYRCLARANAALQAMDVSRACAELADATARVELSPVLYRVVTTMPREPFAIIRAYTDGRSAIQSRPYRQIHLICSPQPPSPVPDKLPRVKVPSPTLQESFTTLAARLDTPEVDQVATQMRALDTSWRAMKRTHWGVTLKTIGKVPGTGGTSGADYLKHTAELSLFPELAPR